MNRLVNSPTSQQYCIDPVAPHYQAERAAHWDGVARRLDAWHGLGSVYHHRVKQVYRFLIPPGRKILELGCGRGDLLASLQPERGVGVDFSEEMLRRATTAHPGLEFIRADVHDLTGIEGTFDFVILSDLVNDLWDVQKVFEQLTRLCAAHTRIILNSYSRLWELPLKLAQGLNLALPSLKQNWLTPEDIKALLVLAGFEPIRQWLEILWPFSLPGVEAFFNRFLVRFWPFELFGLTNFVLARPWSNDQQVGALPFVSIIVPARNEAGNINDIFARIPEMGAGTEIVFVEGHSKDDTYAVIERTMAEYPRRNCKLFKQTGDGKGDAVRLGFAQASGDVLMILDADLTVSPEDLLRFYTALVSGKGEFINGVRLVYPLEGEAMRFLNLLGNKFFSLAFTWLLGQPLKDTLCGTKALWRKDYQQIAAGRPYFGDFDPFGDFDLLFGAAKNSRKIIDLPVRYHERVYGTTNIRRWRNGWFLLKMAWFAARRLKFN